MLPVTNLQLLQEQKENARIRMKIEANAVRNDRFRNARQRVIGLDVAGLDAQVAEKRQNQADDAEAKRIDRLRALEMDRVMESAAEEERRMQAFYKEQQKNSWEEALAFKKSQIDNIPDFGPVFGTSSCQEMSGIDLNLKERKVLQREQNSKWIQEQIAEKSFRKAQMYEEEMQYADMLKQIDVIREMNEKEEEAMKKSILASTVGDNKLKAFMNAERIAAERAAKLADTNAVVSLPLPDEDQALALDANGRIIRKDAFKGFTPAQRRKILQDNEMLKQFKKDVQEQDRKQESDWAIQQFLSQRAMEETLYEESMLREAEKQRHLQILESQRASQALARQFRDKDRFGSIGSGFYSNFGKTCR